MCSIVGFYRPNPLVAMGNGLVGKVYRHMAVASWPRGKDAGGFFAWDEQGRAVQKNVEGSAGLLAKLDRVDFETVRGVIQNHRAEPTNEFLAKKTEAEIMPFEYDGVWSVHNGTVANDKEILAGYVASGGKPPTTVDSWAIPYAIREGRFDELRGSLAVAWVDSREERPALNLFKNYQPLSLFFVERLQAFFFCSLPEYFLDAVAAAGLHSTQIEFPHYSHIKILHDMTIERRSVWTRNRKAIVICSGGLDSTVAAEVACRENDDVVIAHFQYGCKAEPREVQAVKNITKAFQEKYPGKGVRSIFLDLSFLKTLGGATIVDGQDADIGGAIQGTEFCIDWVPARNTAMLGLVASYCDRFDIGSVYMGLNLEESGAYCDNTVEFHRAFEQVMSLGTHARPRIVNPLDNSMKRDIVKMMDHPFLFWFVLALRAQVDAVAFDVLPALPFENLSHGVSFDAVVGTANLSALVTDDLKDEHRRHPYISSRSTSSIRPSNAGILMPVYLLNRVKVSSKLNWYLNRRVSTILETMRRFLSSTAFLIRSARVMFVVSAIGFLLSNKWYDFGCSWASCPKTDWSFDETLPRLFPSLDVERHLPALFDPGNGFVGGQVFVEFF